MAEEASGELSYRKELALGVMRDDQRLARGLKTDTRPPEPPCAWYMIVNTATRHAERAQFTVLRLDAMRCEALGGVLFERLVGATTIPGYFDEVYVQA